MKRMKNWILPGVLAVLLLSAATVHPQLSVDEQSAIVEAVVQTMNPDAMRATLIVEVEADLIQKFTDAGYVGLAGALSVGMDQTAAQPAQVTPAPASPTAAAEALIGEGSDGSAADPVVSAEATRIVDSNPMEFWNGAVLQPDGTYRGLHAKQVNAYAYTIGEDEDGVVRQFHTEYTPNTRFNVDVVFENDGSLIWPARIEMRHVGNVGEYTGHAESVYIDRTYDPIKPGDRCAFTISAYGSENLGWTTFYFQLYDAESGNPIEGGQGSFTYNAI